MSQKIKQLPSWFRRSTNTFNQMVNEHKAELEKSAAVFKEVSLDDAYKHVMDRFDTVKGLATIADLEAFLDVEGFKIDKAGLDKIWFSVEQKKKEAMITPTEPLKEVAAENPPVKIGDEFEFVMDGKEVMVKVVDNTDGVFHVVPVEDKTAIDNVDMSKELKNEILPNNPMSPAVMSVGEERKEVGVHSVTAKCKKVASGDGFVLEYPELTAQLKGAIEDLATAIESTYESYDGKLEEVEFKSRDGFISSNDGGYEYTTFAYARYLEGSGTSLPTEKSQIAVDKRMENGKEMAKEEFIKEYSEELKDIHEDKINYNGLYELGKGDLAEKLEEMERGFNEDDSIMFQVMAFVKYNQDNSISFNVQGAVNWEAPYHRRGSNREDWKEIVVEFTDEEDMKKNFSKVISAVKECGSFLLGGSKQASKVASDNIENTIDELFDIDSKAFLVTKAKSGGEVRKNKEMLTKYVSKVKELVGGKKYPKEVYDELEDMNYHLMIDTLIGLGAITEAKHTVSQEVKEVIDELGSNKEATTKTADEQDGYFVKVHGNEGMFSLTLVCENDIAQDDVIRALRGLDFKNFKEVGNNVVVWDVPAQTLEEATALMREYLKDNDIHIIACKKKADDEKPTKLHEVGPKPKTVEKPDFIAPAPEDVTIAYEDFKVAKKAVADLDATIKEIKDNADAAVAKIVTDKNYPGLKKQVDSTVNKLAQIMEQENLAITQINDKFIALESHTDPEKIETKEEQIKKIQAQIEALNKKVLAISAATEPIAKDIETRILHMFDATKKDASTDVVAEGGLLEALGDIYKSLLGLLDDTNDINALI